MEKSKQQSFWQFSDELRLHSSNLANLSLNDSIWSVNSYGVKKTQDRRNFDITVGAPAPHHLSSPSHSHKINMNMNMNITPQAQPQLNADDSGWKFPSGINLNLNLNGGFNKGVYPNGVNDHNNNTSHLYNNNNNNINNNDYNLYNNNNGKMGYKGQKNESLGIGLGLGGKHGKKNKEVKKEMSYNNNNNNNNDNSSSNGNGNGVDKRFKTLPPSESLPRNETVGGYIFVCNNDTMEENLKRQLFGLPPRYRDSVRQITPGLPLFLYNYSTHQLHGIYEASSFGGTNIDPMAWEDKKNPGESRFPAQVRVHTRKLCEPLDEDAFRPILHHYDGPKFRLELSVPEALSLLDIFEDGDA